MVLLTKFSEVEFRFYLAAFLRFLFLGPIVKVRAFRANKCHICGERIGQTCYLENHINKAHHECDSCDKTCLPKATSMASFIKDFIMEKDLLNAQIVEKLVKVCMK